MSTKKNKSAKKGSAKKSGNSSKGKNKSRSSATKKPQKGKGAEAKAAPVPAAPAPVTAPVVAERLPVAPIPIPAPPSQLPTSTLAPSSSPIGASALEVKAQEKKPRVIRITEPPMPTPQTDRLANQAPAPFQSRPSLGTPAPPAQPSDLKTLSGTLKKVCVNYKHFRPLTERALQDVVSKTHSDVKVTYDEKNRHVKLTQGAATEEFKY